MRGYGEDSPEHREAIAKLDSIRGPDWPESLDYLRGWFYELHRTRGFDMNGPVAFSYPMIDSWARLTGRSPDAREVEALFALDLAYRFPDPKGK